MIYQRKFSEGVIERLREKIKTGDEDLISTYLNKEKFNYPFKDEDYKNCDFPPVPENLGSEMVKSFNNLKNQREDNVVDFRTADFECAKLLYESIKITPRQAADKDFWNYLHHFDLYEYIHLRWNEIENPSRTSTEQYILTHWLMNNTSQKQLVFYPLTGLWWSIHLSQDESLEEKYELSKVYFGNNRTRTTTFGGSSFVRHREALLGILEYLYVNDVYLNREKGDKIGKFINLLGGTKPLGFFDRSWFRNKLEERYPDFGLQTKDKKTLNRKIGEPLFATSDGSDLEEMVSADSESQIFLFFLDIIKKPQRLFLNSKPSSNAEISLPILKKYEHGFLLFCYENGQVNRVPVKSLLNKSLDSNTPTSYIYRESNLVQVLLSIEEGLLLVTGKGSRGPAGKIYETEFIPTNDHLTSKGKKLLNRKQIWDYEILPLALKPRIKNLISYGPHILFDQQEYPKEWHLIEQYRCERKREIELEKEASAKLLSEDLHKQAEAQKSFLNIYNASGKFFFSKGKPAPSTLSVELPEHYQNKFLFLFYDNGQVAKFPLKKLSPFSMDLQNNGKYSRAHLIGLEIGSPDSNIVVSRNKSKYTYTKIHKAEWIADCKNLNEKGNEIVDLPNKLAFALLPAILPSLLKRMVEIDIKYGIDLNQRIYKDQKNILKNLVPHFFVD